jgi:23S rRNA (cytidine1920-2'-O)/16S rRNA (cytidine1409-2'-O)-methyltransferase
MAAQGPWHGKDQPSTQADLGTERLVVLQVLDRAFTRTDLERELEDVDPEAISAAVEGLEAAGEVEIDSGHGRMRAAPCARRLDDLGYRSSVAEQRVRLDTLLADRGLFSSRSRAAAAVMAGKVLLGKGRRRARKPSELVDPAVLLDVGEGPAFVSRGGIKLANALASCDLEVAGRWALDVGSSTGGFTDCLLQRGTAQVIAVDVGYGLLSWSLRNDPRVTVLERTNARVLTPKMLPYRPDLACVDVSFISLSIVLRAVLGCMAHTYDVLAMVKPQFEVGRARVGKGGVVRDPAARRAALEGVGEAALGLGASVLGYHSSGLPGPKGNRETFLHLAERGRDGGADGLEVLGRMAAEVESEQGQLRELEP